MKLDSIVSLRLARGVSRHRGFTLGPDCRRALFRVGSAAECNWRVHGPGVAPHHFMLLWKAGELTLVDVGAGDLWLDGAGVTLCQTIETGCISFAGATILVERIRHAKMPVTLDATGIGIEFENNS